MISDNEACENAARLMSIITVLTLRLKLDKECTRRYLISADFCVKSFLTEEQKRRYSITCDMLDTVIEYVPE